MHFERRIWPFKMHKIIFFPEKIITKICVFTLPKIFRPVTLNTLISLNGLIKEGILEINIVVMALVKERAYLCLMEFPALINWTSPFQL